MQRLAITGAELLSETLAMYDELSPQPQNDSAATFAPIMKKEDGLIDWSQSGREIQNCVRGFQPFPTTFTKYGEKKLTIWKAEAVQYSKLEIQSGEIVAAKGDDFIVGCGNETTLKIVELQIEGKRRMNARDFLNGIKIKAGEKLG